MTRYSKLVIITLMTALFLFGCEKVDITVSRLPGDSTPAPTSTGPAITVAPPTATPDVIETKLQNMTLEQKVAQVFIITPEALTDVSVATAAGDATKEALTKYPVGGIIYFAQNVRTPDQLQKMTTNIQTYADEVEGMKLFLAMDEEGGTVSRIANNANFDVKKYTNMKSIGDTGETDQAKEVGTTIGSYLTEYGINLDFAPDADVLTNSSNQVIGSRSFGTTGKTVAEMAVAMANGLQESGVWACFKHFPGHGATVGDTHSGMATTDRSLKQLKKQELVPFASAAENNIPFVMVSHISVPKVIGDNTPSSLSSKMMTDILRTDLKYEGIIITDAMNMGAIINNYDPQKAVLTSFEAGADMILMPNDFKKSYNRLLKAVQKGTITEERLDESVRRILKLKLQTTEA